MTDGQTHRQTGRQTDRQTDRRGVCSVYVGCLLDLSDRTPSPYTTSIYVRPVLLTYIEAGQRVCHCHYAISGLAVTVSARLTVRETVTKAEKLQSRSRIRFVH